MKDDYYKKRIQDNNDIEMIDKSLDNPINSTNPDYVMQKIRDDYLKDSSVTIFLIGQHSAENDFNEDQQYIKKELQASLYHSQFHGRNGILGIVIPSMYVKIFKGSYKCNNCGNNHNDVEINDDTVIKEFSANYYIQEGHTSCAWSPDERYCLLVRWEDFINNPNKYIDNAFDKTKEPIVSKIKVRPK